MLDEDLPLLDEDLPLDDKTVSGQKSAKIKPVEIQAAEAEESELEEGELEESEAEESGVKKILAEQISIAREKSLHTGRMSSDSVVTKRKPVHERLGVVSRDHDTASNTLGCKLNNIFQNVRSTKDKDELERLLTAAEFEINKSPERRNYNTTHLWTLIRVRVWQAMGSNEDHQKVLALVGGNNNFGYRCSVAYSQLALGQLDEAWEGFKGLLDLPPGDLTKIRQLNVCLGLCKVAEKLEQKDCSTALSYCNTLMRDGKLGDRDKDRLLTASLNLLSSASSDVNSLLGNLALAARKINENSEHEALTVLDALEIEENTENIGSVLYRKSFLSFNAIHRLISREGYDASHKSDYIKVLVDAQGDCEKAVSLSSDEKFKGKISSLKGHVEKLISTLFSGTPEVSLKLKRQSKASYSRATRHDPTRGGNYKGQKWRQSEHRAHSVIREKEARHGIRPSDDQVPHFSRSEAGRDRSRSPRSSYRSSRSGAGRDRSRSPHSFHRSSYRSSRSGAGRDRSRSPRSFYRSAYDTDRSYSRHSQSGSRHRSSHESQYTPSPDNS
ncbi:hypothetical protein [Endozoicomonas numazuensis]|uniref:hypothetical protein n=1 Tax=Endozoicomonas numazuensis TaxID=1137799 RepID=UPI0012683567|nr:hypothetical protein [Endozoicomonas numazuensis]